MGFTLINRFLGTRAEFRKLYGNHVHSSSNTSSNSSASSYGSSNSRNDPLTPEQVHILAVLFSRRFSYTRISFHADALFRLLLLLLLLLNFVSSFCFISSSFFSTTTRCSCFLHVCVQILALEELHRRVMPFLLRREKSDVLRELPPKVIVLLLFLISFLWQSYRLV